MAASCTLIEVESSCSSSRSSSLNALTIFSQMPFSPHRSNRCHTEFQFPNRSRKSLHGTPVFKTCRTAAINSRLLLPDRPGSASLPGTRSLIRSQSSSVSARRFDILRSSLTRSRPLCYHNSTKSSTDEVPLVLVMLPEESTGCELCGRTSADF